MKRTVVIKNAPSDARLSRREALTRVAGVSIAAAAAEQLGQAQNTSLRNATTEEFLQVMKQVSNWNRWGKDDELGAVNLITPAKRKQAVNLVKEGASFSMARSAEMEAAVDNPQPIVRKVTRLGAASPATGMGGTGDT